MQLPRLLYHYCSVESFFSIITSKAVWLSNSNHLNDGKENKWLEEQFFIIKEMFSGPNYKDFHEMFDTHFEWNKPHTFLFCLSEISDSLGQWRGYADDAKGISIGFNPAKFKFQKDWPSWNLNRDKTIGIRKVEYNSRRQFRFIKDLATKAKIDYDAKQGDEWDLVPVFLALEMTKWSTIFKHPGFKEEKEWRIIHTPLNDEYNDLSLCKHNLSSELFRYSRGQITSYYNLDLASKFNSELIPQIVLGPKCSCQVDTLYKFLNAHGLTNTDIYISSSSYK